MTPVVVTVFFVLCFLPSNVYFLAVNIVGSPLYSTSAAELTNLLATINCTLNPVLYTWKLSVFHDGIRNMIYRSLKASAHGPFENKPARQGQVHPVEIQQNVDKGHVQNIELHNNEDRR